MDVGTRSERLGGVVTLYVDSLYSTKSFTFFPVQTVWLMVYGRSEGDYGRGLEDAEGDAEEAAVDT